MKITGDQLNQFVSASIYHLDLNLSNKGHQYITILKQIKR